MDKKLRKQLEEQLSIEIALFLKKMDQAITAKMEKPIKSASKDLAKKFIKIRKEINEQIVADTKAAAKKTASAKKSVKKPAVKKATAKPAKKVRATRKRAAKKTAPKE